jgi:hypothetical protein
VAFSLENSMTSVAISAQGSKLEIGAAGADPIFTQIKGFKSYTGFDGSASEIDTTDLNSTAKEFLLGLQDNGNFNFELHINHADPGQLALTAARKTGALTPFKLTLPDGSIATWKGLVKSVPLQGAVDGIQSGSVTTRISGDVDWK